MLKVQRVIYVMNNFQAQQQPTQYQEIYGSPLIDEIHNYFPALLYNREHFLEVPDVLNYMHSQIQQHFNPYNIGQRQYRQTNRIINSNAPPATPVAPAPSATATTSNATPNRTRQTTALYVNYTIPSLFRNLLDEFDRRESFEDAVPIIPSNYTLSTATTLSQYTGQDIVGTCSICQEEYELGSQLRCLNQCRHYFHKTCIDSWFLSSTRCPICRNDIRT